MGAFLTRVCGPLIGVTILCSAFAWGQANTKLKTAIRAYDQGELKQAVSLLEEVLSELTLARQDRARAWLYLALSEASRKNLGKARSAFETALKNDPTIDVDRDRIAPNTVGLFDAVRNQTTGLLEVKVAGGAKGMAWVDKRAAGPVPAKLRVLIGKHHVEILSKDKKSGFEASDVEVSAGKMTKLVATMSTLMGVVVMRLSPPETQVFQGARLVASGPSARLELPPGEHTVTLRHPGYLDREEKLRVARGKELALSITMTPSARAWYKRRRVWGYISGGLAVALAATGLVLGKLAKDAESEIQDSFQSGTLSFDQWQSLDSTGQSRALSANVLFGIAGAAAVTSLVLIVTGGKDRMPAKPAKRSWRLIPTPKGAVVSVRF